MNYITFNEMIEVNGLLEEKGLNFKVHLRDACGKQSCWIEPLGNCACEGRYEEMYQVVEEYFRRKGQKITFDETKLNFFAFARHGRALTGASPEHAQIVGSV
jgi:hypothetical protein